MEEDIVAMISDLLAMHRIDRNRDGSGGGGGGGSGEKKKKKKKKKEDEEEDDDDEEEEGKRGFDGIVLVGGCALNVRIRSAAPLSRAARARPGCRVRLRPRDGLGLAGRAALAPRRSPARSAVRGPVSFDVAHGPSDAEAPNGANQSSQDGTATTCTDDLLVLLLIINSSRCAVAAVCGGEHPLEALFLKHARRSALLRWNRRRRCPSRRSPPSPELGALRLDFTCAATNGQPHPRPLLPPIPHRLRVLFVLAVLVLVAAAAILDFRRS